MIRSLAVFVAALLSVGCEDPFAYAESWEHNTCASEIPSDQDEAMGVALDLIRGHGYSVVSTDGPTRTVMPLDRVELGPDANIMSFWHELVHVRQDKSDGAATPHRARVDEWIMAYEAQAARQTLIVWSKFYKSVNADDAWTGQWCQSGYREWCQSVIDEVMEATDEDCLGLVGH